MPGFARGYDALANTYKAQKYTVEANKNYFKARQINPEIDKDPIWVLLAIPI